MRTPLDSPFSPGSDTVPQIWAGRSPQLADWSQTLRPRRIAGVPERGRVILGEPGTGKSALVRRIFQQASSQGDWATPQLRIPSGTDPLKRVAAALLDLAHRAGIAVARDKKAKALLERVEKVAVSGVSLSVKSGEGPDPYTSLTELLVEIGRAAIHQRNTMVMVHIDEVQNISDEKVRSQLLIALGDALVHEEAIEAPGGYEIRRALPLAVYLTGLPEFAEMTAGRNGATFARRFKTDMLTAISDEDLMMALNVFVDPGWDILDPAGTAVQITMTPTAQKAISALSNGEPYLFQLAGEKAWTAGSGACITEEDVLEGWKEAAAEAEEHVYRILDRLPPKERQLVEAMGGLDPESRTLTNIASLMGLAKTSDAGTTARRLDNSRGIINRGKPYTFRNRAVEALLTSEWPY